MKSRRSALVVWIPLLGAIGCGTFLSVDDDDPPSPANPTSSPSGPAGVPSGDGSADDHQQLLDPPDGATDGGAVDAEEGGPTCIVKIQQCNESKECCDNDLPGTLKYVCRVSPRVCNRCVPRDGGCSGKEDCCSFGALCFNGVCNK